MQILSRLIAACMHVYNLHVCIHTACMYIPTHACMRVRNVRMPNLTYICKQQSTQHIFACIT